MRTTAALAGTVLVLVAGCASPDAGPEDRPSPVPTAPTTSAAATQTARPVQEVDRAAHSTTDPASIWVVVNKKHPVDPLDYRPETSLVRGYQVAKPAAGPLGRLLAESDRRRLGFKIASAFRSYAYQQAVYANAVAVYGQPEADRRSARPGHSEHQTGLAVDLVVPASPACDFEPCFAGTPGGRWLARHAWRYGFVVRYPAGAAAITGYSPEPWHLRYVGRPLAAELRRTGVATLEEFFGIRGGGYRR